MQPAMFYLMVGGMTAWGIYRRVRRSIGRQPLRPTRSIVRLVILGLASASIILVGILLNWRILAGFGGGLVPGIALGFLGLKLTQFETTPDGQHFFKPDTRIGLALSLLLTGRLIYRMVVLNGMVVMNDMSVAPGHPPPMQSPLTYLIAGLTIGYYIVYSIGLIIHAHEKYKAQRNAVPPILGSGVSGENAG